MTSDLWVTLAHIVRPQGRRGEVVAELLTDFPEKFAERKRLFIGRADAATARELQLEDFRLMDNRVVLKFCGIDSIETAETLRALDVLLPFSERAPLDPDSAYISDLIGCQLYDSSLALSPRLLGTVVDVDREATSSDLLMVELTAAEAGAPATTAAIPFVKAFLDRLDVPNRRIDMRIPEGLLDLNPPAKPKAEKPLRKPKKSALRRAPSAS